MREKRMAELGPPFGGITRIRFKGFVYDVSAIRLPRTTRYAKVEIGKSKVEILQQKTPNTQLPAPNFHLPSCGYKTLNELAAKALLQWRFQPGTRGPVEVPVDFYVHGGSRTLH